MKLYESEVSEAVKTGTQLPKPSGYRLLLALPQIKEKTEGGVFLADSQKHAEHVAAVTGFVVAMGPDAYKDPAKFPGGPWCKEGDWVICRSYQGTRVKIHGQEFRFVNDDTVDGVVDDPRGIERSW